LSNWSDYTERRVSAWTGDAAGKQFIEDQFEQGNIVYGVWLDATKPHGIDYEVLKSSERLESHRPVIWETVVPCESRDQAIHFRTMFFSA
jgi:hypothetical protein